MEFKMRILFYSLIFTFLFNGNYFGEKLKIYFFHSPECENCQHVEEHLLPQINNKYKDQLEYIWVDIDIPENYDILTLTEDYFQKYDKEYPIVVFADTMLGSREEIEPSFDSLIGIRLENQYFDNKNDKLDSILTGKLTKKSTPEEYSENKKIVIVYFNEPKCPKCARVEKCLEHIEKKYANVIIHRKKDNDENKKLLQAFNDYYHTNPELHLVTPAVFIGDSSFIREDAADNRILGAVEKYLSTGAEDPLPKIALLEDQAETTIQKRFQQFGIFAIIMAGLLDGINPCAFTTIIFFISYLSFLGRRKKEIIVVGISYSLSVFLTYFLIGLGVLEVLIYLQIFSIISKVFIGLTGLLAVVLSLFSIFNFFKVKKGEENEIALQLPTRVKQRIHKTIREYSKTRNLIFGALITGFFVSIFELACTGQVYLPTITFMVHHPQYQMKATFLLFLYNFMFIVPLIIIFMLAYKGLTSKQLTKIWKGKLESIELAIALLFMLLGAFLIYSVFS